MNAKIPKINIARKFVGLQKTGLQNHSYNSNVKIMARVKLRMVQANVLLVFLVTSLL